jgi:hypothetical protein
LRYYNSKTPPPPIIFLFKEVSSEIGRWDYDHGTQRRYNKYQKPAKADIREYRQMKSTKMLSRAIFRPAFELEYSMYARQQYYSASHVTFIKSVGMRTFKFPNVKKQI